MTAPHPIDIIVGGNIRKWRNRRGMSLNTLAKSIGVTYQQLQKYESAANRISASRLYVLKGALSLTLAELFYGAAGVGLVSKPARVPRRTAA